MAKFHSFFYDWLVFRFVCVCLYISHLSPVTCWRLSVFLSVTILVGLTWFLPVVYLTFWPHHISHGTLVTQPGIEPLPPALEAWSLNHWTTRKVPLPVVLTPSWFFSCPVMHLICFIWVRLRTCHSSKNSTWGPCVFKRAACQDIWWHLVPLLWPTLPEVPFPLCNTFLILLCVPALQFPLTLSSCSSDP